MSFCTLNDSNPASDRARLRVVRPQGAWQCVSAAQEARGATRTARGAAPPRRARGRARALRATTRLPDRPTRSRQHPGTAAAAAAASLRGASSAFRLRGRRAGELSLRLWLRSVRCCFEQMTIASAQLSLVPAAALLIATVGAAAWNPEISDMDDPSKTYNFLAIGDWGDDSADQHANAAGMGVVAEEIDAALVIALGDNFYTRRTVTATPRVDTTEASATTTPTASTGSTDSR